MKRILSVIILFPLLSVILFSNGAADAAASSSGRGRYLADEGLIIPPEEVIVESYIAQVDYHYPDPSSGEMGAFLYNGNRQLSSRGQESVLQLGIQGRQMAWEEVPPMNLAFVIDLSASMADDNKLEWVKSAFRLFLDRMRPQDYVSVITFNDSSEILFQSGHVNDEETRTELINRVDELYASGGSDLEVGLKEGYAQLMRNYRAEFVNRVLYLSDGTEISSRLSRAGGQTGKIRATLVWNDRNDLDLHMITPSGEEIYYGNKYSSSGGMLDVDQNVNGETEKPVENIFWADTSKPEEGRYTVFVHHYNFHEEKRNATPFTVQLKYGKEVLYYEGEIDRKGNRVTAFEFDYAENTRRKAEIFQFAEQYKALGINVTTIGVGTDFDLDFMNDLAIESGGSSRFIADREEMEEMFGPEFDRMIISAARNLVIDLKFLVPVEIRGTWGYKHQIGTNAIRYRQDTLHAADYETILVKYAIPPGLPLGPVEIARAEISYESVGGRRKTLKTEPLVVIITESKQPVSGYSDGTVLHSGTMMDFAERLVDIGSLYYDVAGAYIDEETGMPPEIRNSLEKALTMTRQGRAELENAVLRLEEEDVFSDEIGILDAYEGILGKQLAGEKEGEATESVAVNYDDYLPPLPSDISLQNHIQSLVEEIVLGLPATEEVTVAVPGVSTAEDSSESLAKMVNGNLLTQISQRGNLRIVERTRLDQIIEEQKLALSGLIDTDSAVEIGRLTSAKFILTGTLMETTESVLIFVRVLNVETGIIESAAQTIVLREQVDT